MYFDSSGFELHLSTVRFQSRVELKVKLGRYSLIISVIVFRTFGSEEEHS